MTNSFTKSVLKTTTLLAMCLALSISCSNMKKKKAADGTGTDVSLEAGQEAGMDLALNADSDSGKAGGLKTVYFDYNSSTLTSDAKGTLTANADFLKSNKSVTVQVEGHCDERGSVEYNIALGESRANSIKKYLKALGVQDERLTTISFGKERPIEFGHDESAWGRNRRGNFVVTAK